MTTFIFIDSSFSWRTRKESEETKNLLFRLENMESSIFGVEENQLSLLKVRAQPMSIALPAGVAKTIEKFCSKNNNKADDKLFKVVQEILNQTNDRLVGYLFDNRVGVDHRYLYLETCCGSLDTFIHGQAQEENFQWTILQELCCQMVDSVAWLHQTNVFYNGQLHPRNIYIKNSENRRKIKLFLPEKPNYFSNSDQVYAKCWSSVYQQVLDCDETEKSIRADISSLVILIYFIQSRGHHPYQWGSTDNQDYEYISKNIKSGEWEVEKSQILSENCFCNREECKEIIACKYRTWINSLVKDWAHFTLLKLNPTEEITSIKFKEDSAERIKRHPFFWKAKDVLFFIEKSFCHLDETLDEEEKKNFGWTEKDESENEIDNSSENNSNPVVLRNTQQCRMKIISNPQRIPEWKLGDVLQGLTNNHQNIINFLQERINPRNGAKSSKPIETYFQLIQQIRNKSCHWSEESECSLEAKKELGNIHFIAPSSLENGDMEVYPSKYCLFWMVHFPKLLLYTWKEMKKSKTFNFY